jgi:hypothetical protein
MAFTEQDRTRQEQEITRLSHELSRLNQVFAEQKKALGLSEDEVISIDPSSITPELESAMAEAKAQAEQAGHASANALQSASSSTTAAHHARRGAMRI